MGPRLSTDSSGLDVDLIRQQWVWQSIRGLKDEFTPDTHVDKFEGPYPEILYVNKVYKYIYTWGL